MIDKIKQKDTKHEWGFISAYRAQHKEGEVIFKKDWALLSTDKILTKFIPENPIFMYRKGQFFGDKVVKKILNPQIRPTMFWDSPGFHACRCISCRQVRTRLRGVTEFQSTANSKIFKIKDFISYMSTYVVYALQCPCNLM